MPKTFNIGDLVQCVIATDTGEPVWRGIIAKVHDRPDDLPGKIYDIMVMHHYSPIFRNGSTFTGVEPLCIEKAA